MPSVAVFVVPWFRALLVCCLAIVWVILKLFQSPLLLPVYYYYYYYYYYYCSLQWLRDLRRGSAVTRLLWIRVRVAPAAWMLVFCESKRNTNLMQHCAGFISAQSLYMFRASLIWWCDDLPATITPVPGAAVPIFLILLMMGAWRPNHVEWLCRNKTCTVLYQVGVLFGLYWDARKYKSKIFCECCALLGGGLCVGLITHPEESYQLWCVWVWSWYLDSWRGSGPLWAVIPCK